MPLQAALDLRPVPARLLPLVPLFCRSLTQMGTAKESFIELTERIGRKTGGVSVFPFTSPVRGKEQPVSYVMVRAVLYCLLPCTGMLCTNAVGTARCGMAGRRAMQSRPLPLRR